MANIDTLQQAVEKLNADVVTALQGLGASVAGALQAGREPAARAAAAPRPVQPPGVREILGPLARLLPANVLQALAGAGRIIGPLQQSAGAIGRGFTDLLTATAGRGATAAAAAGAGGGAAAAGGAGAAGAAGAAGTGTAAALASNPVGWAVAAAAAVAAVVAALVLLPPAIKDWTRSLLESQRHLAEVSGAMAAVLAESDLRRMQRDMEIGNRLAGSARELADAHTDLAGTTKELEIAFGHLINKVGTAAAKAGKSILQDFSLSDLGFVFGGPAGWIAAGLARLTGTTLSIEQVAKAINKHVEAGLRKDIELPMGEWLEARAEEARQGIRRGAPEFGAPRVFGP
jgi:hypothetical protein